MALSVSDSDTVSFQTLVASWVGVAYHEATRLPNGDVLLTGGNADQAECPPALGYAYPIICPQAQLATYTNVDKTLVVRKETLAIPRFGHRVTRLLDNTLLITGGVAANTRLAREAEVYNPRTGAESELVVDNKGQIPICEALVK